MADPKTRLDTMVQKLRAQEYRITPQRLAVLKILAASKGHPSVEKIYDQVKVDFPTTSLATVYKTVALAKALGAVHRARELSAAGARAVPLFWLCADDHDWRECAALGRFARDADGGEGDGVCGGDGGQPAAG